MVRLEIGKHPHGFKHGIVKILRFVHDQNKTFPGEHGLKQDLVQLIVHRDETHSIGIDVQVVKDVLEKFTGVTLGLEHKHGARGIAQFF